MDVGFPRLPYYHRAALRCVMAHFSPMFCCRRWLVAERETFRLWLFINHLLTYLLTCLLNLGLPIMKHVYVLIASSHRRNRMAWTQRSSFGLQRRIILHRHRLTTPPGLLALYTNNRKSSGHLNANRDRFRFRMKSTFQ